MTDENSLGPKEQVPHEEMTGGKEPVKQDPMELIGRELQSHGVIPSDAPPAQWTEASFNWPAATHRMETRRQAERLAHEIKDELFADRDELADLLQEVVTTDVGETACILRRVLPRERVASLTSLNDDWIKGVHGRPLAPLKALLDDMLTTMAGLTLESVADPEPELPRPGAPGPLKVLGDLVQHRENSMAMTGD